MLRLLQIVALCIMCSLQLAAQISMPDLSYASTIKQKVGFTNFTINYERPMQRGRVIFGGLVPYGKPWRTGAGFHNTVSFDQDVYMGGKKVAKGTYHLVTIPDLKTWKVILTNDSNAFSQNKPYEPEKEEVRIEVKSETSKRHFEASTIEIDVVNNDAVFTVGWDYTFVQFTIQTGTTAKVMAQIRDMMRSGAGDADQYGDAADFIAYNLTGLKPTAKDTALVLVNKAIAASPKAWMYRVKRNIYWFSRDLNGYEKASREWITFLKKDEKEKHDDEIKMIEKELEVYRKIL
jgi:hypothetical protein